MAHSLWDITESGQAEEKAPRAVTACRAVSKAVAEYGVATGTPPNLFPMGLELVDKVLGGLSPRMLTVVSARTGVGKSSLALNCAFSAARQGTKAGIVFVEDPIEMVGTRIAARLSGVNDVKIRTGRMSEEERAKVLDVVEEVADLPLYVVDAVSASIDAVISAAHDLVTQGCKVIYIDYLQAIYVPEVHGIFEATRVKLDKFNDFMKMGEFCLVAVSMMNRPIKGKEDAPATRYDNKGSGDIENGAKLLVVAERQGELVSVRIEKNNFGPEGDSMLFRRGDDGQLYPTRTTIREDNSDRPRQESRPRSDGRQGKTAAVEGSRSQQAEWWAENQGRC